MQIAIGCDHGGFSLKEALVSFLTSQNIEIIDCGTNSSESCDYPDHGHAVACHVASKTADFGIVICKSGIGMSIIANKVKGVRAALCHSEEDARSARQHNHANVLAMSANLTAPALAERIVSLFLSTDPEPGRHERRVEKISEYEKQDC